jgi:ferrous iron transport protein A
MLLNEIRKGGRFRIKAIRSCNECTARLMAMGMLPEQTIRLLHEAPFGDPIAVEFNHCQISVRRADAAHVEVEPLP